jgi:hypothetical protein
VFDYRTVGTMVDVTAEVDIIIIIIKIAFNSIYKTRKPISRRNCRARRIVEFLEFTMNFGHSLSLQMNLAFRSSSNFLTHISK